jgi:hypothetical protein
MAEEKEKTTPAQNQEQAEKPAEENEEAFQETETTVSAPAGMGFLNFLTPEGLMMMSLAGMLDMAGFLFTLLDLAFGVGEIPSLVSDGLGLLLVGSWLMFRSGASVSLPSAQEISGKRKGAVQQVGKKLSGQARSVGRKSFSRLMGAFVTEVIPLLGALPFWTILVYSELKNTPSYAQTSSA